MDVLRCRPLPLLSLSLSQGKLSNDALLFVPWGKIASAAHVATDQNKITYVAPLVRVLAFGETDSVFFLHDITRESLPWLCGDR